MKSVIIGVLLLEDHALRVRRFWNLLCCCLSLALSSTLMGQNSFKNRGLDVNDVAVLFPLDGQDKPWPFVSLEENSTDSDLMNPSVFNDLLSKATENWISAPSQSSIMQMKDWVVVGFRYDPCAPDNDKNTCIQELRLVAQTLSRFGPADTAMHLIYELGRGPLRPDDPVVNDLARLKQDAEALVKASSSGQPLGPHPLLLRASQKGLTAVAELYKSFLLRYARQERLSKLTMMGLRDGTATDWIFFGGDVKDGRWGSAPIPNLLNNETVEFNVGKGREAFQPKPRDSALSTESFFALPPEQILQQKTGLSETLHRLENPDFSNRTTADCLSCHTATTLRLSASLQIPQHLDGITATAPRGVTAFPAPGVLQTHPLHWNLRAFGYFGISPSLSLRVVHEAGRVAEKLNKFMGWDAPGPDCSADPRSVMLCFVNGSIAFGSASSTEQCLKTCQRPR